MYALPELCLYPPAHHYTILYEDFCQELFAIIVGKYHSSPTHGKVQGRIPHFKLVYIKFAPGEPLR